MFSTPSRESPWAWKKWLQASSLCEILISSTRILNLSKQLTKCPSWLSLNLSVHSPFGSHTPANACQTLQVVPVKFLFAKGNTYPLPLEKVEPSLAAFVHAHTHLLANHGFFLTLSYSLVVLELPDCFSDISFKNLHFGLTLPFGISYLIYCSDLAGFSNFTSCYTALEKVLYLCWRIKERVSYRHKETNYIIGMSTIEQFSISQRTECCLIKETNCLLSTAPPSPTKASYSLASEECM